MKRITALMIGLAMLGWPVLAAPPAVPAAAAVDGFSTLLRLAGRWQDASEPLQVEYRVVSRGSAVLETWAVGRPSETVSVYHRDGDSLLMTHYCAQGNQPRLQLASPATADAVQFALRDVSNLAHGGSHLVDLSLRFEGDVLVRTEVYAAGDARETTTVRFHRAP